MEAARRILVADDEPDIREVLRLYLESSGYEVVEAGDGREALALLESEPFDLCLLDIMMPKVDGYQVLRQLREASHVPVIVISAKGLDPDKILGLDLGADDYLVKPFNPLEAVARASSLLRRVYAFDAEVGERQEGAGRAPGERALLVVRDLTLDQTAGQLLCGDRPVELTPVEYRIMALLMSQPGRVFTKQQIYEAGWEDSYLAADNNVMVAISKLRSKLSDDPSAYIKTIRGLGYRLER